MGLNAVRRLAQACGGRHLRIPSMSDDPDSVAARRRLVALVGADLAADLITHFAKDRVYIPKGPSLHNSRARPIDIDTVDRLTKAGQSASTIARKLQCTPRAIYKKRALLARIAKGTDQ